MNEIVRKYSILAIVTLIFSALLQFHHHDTDGCTVLALGQNTELKFCNYDSYHHCDHTPKSHDQCQLTPEQFVYEKAIDCNLYHVDSFVLTDTPSMIAAPDCVETQFVEHPQVPVIHIYIDHKGLRAPPTI